MSENKPVISFETAENDIERVQNELKRLINDKELCNILGQEFSSRLVEWNTAITKRRTEPFSLVVLGDFKRGKSTVINAILGKAIAPVNVAPETLTINSISYGEYPSAEAVLINGQRIALTPEDLARERLEKLINAFPDKIDYIDIKDNAKILKEIRIVDTPGLSDLDDLDKQVQNYLVNADAVIYVASALSPFSETEQMFLATHIKQQSFSKLYVLVNMIDAMETKDDIKKIIRRINERCEAIIPNCYVYGISGIDEYRRKIGLNRPDIKGFQDFYENEFLKFEVSLKREIILQKDVIRTQRVLTMLNLMLRDTATRIHMISEMLELDNKKLDAMADDLDHECSELASALEANKPKVILSITEMQQEAEGWMYEFFSKLREDILACRNTASTEDIEKHFYSFLMDKVGEAYRKCIEVHQKKLARVLEKTSKHISNKLGLANLSADTQTAFGNVALNDFNSLVAQSVMRVACSPDGQTFPITTISSFKNILRKRRQTGIIDSALENYDDIRNNTVMDLKKVYSAFEEDAMKQLNAIYNSQVNLGRETISQAIEVNSQVANENTRKYLANASRVVYSAYQVMKKYN